MKKNILAFTLLMIAIPYFCSAKEPVIQSMQVSFFSVHNKQAQVATQSEPDVDYCVDMLKQFADLQKKRRLTLEEMMMAMQVMLFLFNNTNDDHSRRIEILLNGKDKIVVPYSAQIFAMLNQQNTEVNPDDDIA